MGMYNEVFTDCPECNLTVEMQVPQVVLGFGGFRLTNPSSMAELTERQKKELAGYVNEKWFYCEPCQNSFQVFVEVESTGSPKRVRI